MVEASRAAKATGADLHALVRRQFGTDDRLYGVVDASRNKELAYAAPRSYGQTIHWLFEEGSGAHMLDVAPYLVPIAFQTRYPYEGSGYLDRWARALGSSAGIVLITPVSTHLLLSHLHELFRVTDEKDHRYYFRFYDPRVLRVYLPTCTPLEAEEFFGPIRCMLYESETPGRMLLGEMRRGRLSTSEQTLQGSGQRGTSGGRRA